jgi:hypothetical protein
MRRERLRALIGGAMVGLGCVQVVWGLLRGEFPFALFGAAYALIGAAYLWFEAGVFGRG